jgi:hypothetical protein
VRNQRYDLVDERMIVRDAGVPREDEVAHHNRDHSVELHIDFGGAGEGGKELFERRRRRGVGAEHASDQQESSLVEFFGGDLRSSRPRGLAHCL